METAPVLSTPCDYTAMPNPTEPSSLSDDDLATRYEIPRTIAELIQGQWSKIALQFPDEMLVDAPRVFERLRDGVASSPPPANRSSPAKIEVHEVRMTILADTSYGACCVDEVAAEHVDAQVVVHYGRACLSPTARLPVIHVFTVKSLDLEAAAATFELTYAAKDECVCLMADLPYSHHVTTLQERLRSKGFTNVFATEVTREPASLIPNRTVPEEVRHDAENLKLYSIFHISAPPTSLLLVLSSRIRQMHILPTEPREPPPKAIEPATTTPLLRRRYALVTRLSTVSVFGILINTLSVKDYMAALSHCQSLITKAGKKYYVFVVGKVNAAKVANFAEIGGWVVIGCWESSLIESKDFYRPIITPFELENALKADEDRTWGTEWVGDYRRLLERKQSNGAVGQTESYGDNSGGSDDEPPDFDLRTGKYISRTRPMGRSRGCNLSSSGDRDPVTAPPSSSLVQRAKTGVATVGGIVSPAAEYLRSQRTWQGLGSDYEIAYERDENGCIRGAAMEEGRSGIARGYTTANEQQSR